MKNLYCTTLRKTQKKLIWIKAKANQNPANIRVQESYLKIAAPDTEIFNKQEIME